MMNDSTMLNHFVLDKQKRYVLGVSGGMDSMYLLDLMIQNGYDFVVCHVNYHKRETSDEDQALVEDYCKQFHILCYTLSQHDYTNENFQAQARHIRYQFMKEIATSLKIQDLVVAHHLNDHVETFLMQLERNNYVDYYGLKSQTTLFDMQLHRPLLDISKTQIADIVKRHQIPYHDDYTNFLPIYKRNQIRQTLSDESLLTYKKQIDQLNQERHVKQNEAKARYHQMIKQTNIQIEQVKNEDIYFWYYYLICQDKQLSTHFSQSLFLTIQKFLKTNKSNATLSLPLNNQLIKSYDQLLFETQEVKAYSYQIEVLKEQSFDEFSFLSDGHDHQGIYITLEDLPLTIRSFKPNDTIIMNYGKKKVARLFIDAKIPMHQRKKWPIVLNNKMEIILVPHLAKNINQMYTKSNWFVVQ